MRTISTQSNGRTVEYRVHEYLNKILVDVVVNGKRHTTGTPEPISKVVQGRNVVGQIGNVMFANQKTWEQVWTAYSEAKAELEASFDYQLHQLKEQRGRLAREMQYAIQELTHHQNERIERAGMGEAYRYDDEALEREIAETEDALSAFDAEHPEIIRLLEAEKDEMVERNRWN